MESLFPAFIAALLAEWGDKSQLLAAGLAARYGRPGPVLAGLAVAALANAGIAAAGGAAIGGMLTGRAGLLLVALALLFAGAGNLIGRAAPDTARDWGAGWRIGPFFASAVCLFLIGFGDKSQFLAFALAARAESPALVAIGAAAGILVAGLPAVLLGGALARTLPLKLIRLALAPLFLLAGCIAAVQGLGLV